MKTTVIHTDQAFEAALQKYPPEVLPRMRELRSLVHKVADQLEQVEVLYEVLRWGEASFVTKHGSTLRMDWKPKHPGRYSLFFQCTTLLVPTFKDVFGDRLHYEGSRAIHLNLRHEAPLDLIAQCISVTLLYHKVKTRPLLGLA